MRPEKGVVTTPRTRRRPPSLGPLPQHDIDEFLLEARIRQIARLRSKLRVGSIWWEAWSRIAGCRIVEADGTEVVVVPMRRLARPLESWADYSIGVPGSRTDRGWVTGEDLPEYDEWFVSRLLIDPRITGILRRAGVSWMVEAVVTLP